MKNRLTSIIIIAALASFTGASYAKSSMRAPEPAPDPTKKKTGEECKTADECQAHHSCSKAGEKNVCTAHPRPKMKPGVVTMQMGSQAIEPFDPKKKKAGEECKVSDECQKHHECKKDGDKGVCTAPPAPKLPPGVVT